MIKTIAKLIAYKKAPAKTFAVLHPLKALKWGAIFGMGGRDGENSNPLALIALAVFNGWIAAYHAPMLVNASVRSEPAHLVMHLVTHLDWTPDKKRVVSSIREVVGFDGPGGHGVSFWLASSCRYFSSSAYMPVSAS